MSDLYPGMRVVCVDDKPSTNRDFPIRVVAGQVYTVAAVVCDGLGVHVEECPHENPYGYWKSHFLPLEYKAISIFRKIAQDVTDGKYVEIKEDA